MRLAGFIALAVLLAGLTPLPASAKATTRPTPQPESGLASWFRAKKPLTGAHQQFPIGSKIRVRAKNGRSVVVTITGRGPFRKGRIIDLSSDAFKKLASLGTGLLKVTIERTK